MKKSLSILFALILIMILTTGCTPGQSGPTVKTIRWQPDEHGFIQFYTNDKQYYEYGFWSWANQIAYNPMEPVKIEVKKISGANYGYGIIFCLQGEDNYHFYQLLIDTMGSYTILKYFGQGDSDWRKIKDWTHSDNLIQGYNETNTIEITRNETTGSFSVFFNNNSTADITFTDDDITNVYSGGKCGFFVVVGPST
jgi:hypothetical protein